jgi:hypothetical protein
MNRHKGEIIRSDLNFEPMRRNFIGRLGQHCDHAVVCAGISTIPPICGRKQQPQHRKSGKAGRSQGPSMLLWWLLPDGRMDRA